MRFKRLAIALAFALITLGFTAGASAASGHPGPSGQGTCHRATPHAPSTVVLCVKPKKLRFTVGNGVDYSAVEASGVIRKATGVFRDVSSTISEQGQIDGTGSQITNAMSLQLNTQFFLNGPTCTAGGNPNCLSWEQFVYAYHACTTSTNVTVSCLFIQYWLINYDNTCPSGWFTFGSDCFTNSNAVQTNTVTAKNLASLKLFGSAANGGNDVVSLTNAGSTFSVTAPDSMIDLAPHWTTAEWGVFGDAGGGQANFGTNNTLQAQTALNGSSTAAPKCVKEGFTGETNNLTLIHTPSLTSGTTPTIATRQTDGTKSTASCATRA